MKRKTVFAFLLAFAAAVSVSAQQNQGPAYFNLVLDSGDIACEYAVNGARNLPEEFGPRIADGKLYFVAAARTAGTGAIRNGTRFTLAGNHAVLAAYAAVQAVYAGPASRVPPGGVIVAGCAERGKITVTDVFAAGDFLADGSPYQRWAQNRTMIYW